MVKGHYQFIFISPERLQIKRFRGHLSRMHNVYVSYCIVDEAHCVSEWGHDFRTSYLRLGFNARKFMKTYSENPQNPVTVPIIALTGTASYDVLADVQRELDIAEADAIIKPSRYEREELNFKIINTVSTTNPIATREQDIRTAIANDKKSKVINLLPNIAAKFAFPSIEAFITPQNSYPNCGIIFCPHKNGGFGVKEHYENIVKELPAIAPFTGMYAGSSSDDSDSDIYEQAQEDFKHDKITQLIATKAFGMGIDKPNIRYTVHINMPQSIESFYQEAGRAGRDRENAYCYILYSNRKKELNEDVSVDKELMLSFHRNSFKGQAREKRILFELLDEIRFPNVNQLELLNEKIDDISEYDVKRAVYWQKFVYGKLYKRLYINGPTFPRGYGFIDLENETAYAETRDTHVILDPSQSFPILERVLEYLKKEKNSDESMLDWIFTRLRPKTNPGIEQCLQGMQFREQRSLLIGFSNDAPSQIAQLLGLQWTTAMVQDANQFCSDENDFFKGLSSSYRKAFGKWWNVPNEKKAQASKFFHSLRDQNDTFKAIYRLAIIGIIDDYEIDYNASLIHVKISKKPDDQYIANLQEYISKYVSVEDANRVPEQVHQQPGNTVIRKCLSYLVDFVYDKIAAKRREAIDLMENAIQAGLHDNSKFVERVNTYFDSRTTEDLRQYLFQYEPDIMFEYMDSTKGEMDALNHLRGACDRLIVENPDNPILFLLRAFSQIVLVDANKQEAHKDFRKGMTLFKNIKEWKADYELKIFNKFYDKCCEYNKNAKQFFESYLVIQHQKWLSQFLHSFLAGVKNERR